MAVHIPFWKRWLSHIIEMELENLESEHDHQLSLCLSDGKIQLNADKAIYSWEEKYDNFYKAFAQMSFDQLPGDEVLILGFGLGSIAQMLEQKFHKKLQFTGIEIDEQVIYLAEKYITHQLQSSIQIIQAPAERFIEITESKFDLICVDVFINTTIPENIKTSAFLQHLKSALNPGGLILFNHLSHYDTDKQMGEAYFKDIFSKVFPNSKIVDVDGNYIFFSDLEYL